jgi:hypothetical protein
MPLGPPGHESLVLNIDSLWAGGPFENSVGILARYCIILLTRSLSVVYRG